MDHNVAAIWRALAQAGEGGERRKRGEGEARYCEDDSFTPGTTGRSARTSPRWAALSKRRAKRNQTLAQPVRGAGR